MHKPRIPKQLAEDILSRSSCSVQVGAVIADAHGILSWGWNHMGRTGFGEHAETHALRRANKARLSQASIYVASRRRKHGKIVTSKPCPNCESRIRAAGIRSVWWQGASGEWHWYSL